MFGIDDPTLLCGLAGVAIFVVVLVASAIRVVPGLSGAPAPNP